MRRAFFAVWLCFGVCRAALGATLEPGDVLVATSGVPPEISALDPLTGAKTPICSCATFNTIRDLAVSASGKLYAIGQVHLPGDVIDDGVAEIDPSDGSQRVVSSGGFFGFLQGVAAAAGDGQAAEQDQDHRNRAHDQTPGSSGRSPVEVAYSSSARRARTL